MARDLSALRAESRAIWDQIAPCWDVYMGEGRDSRNRFGARPFAALLGRRDYRGARWSTAPPSTAIDRDS